MLTQVREGLNAIDDCCCSFVANIRAEIQRKQFPDLTVVDSATVVTRLRDCIESFRRPASEEGWFVRVFDRLRRAPANAVPDASLRLEEAEHLMEQLDSLERKGLLVPELEQRAVAADLLKVRRMSRYDSWIEETLKWIGLDSVAKGREG